MDHPASGFIKLHSWRKAISALAKALGVEIADGEKADLPGGGTAFKFNYRTPRAPFSVRLANGVIIVEAGLFLWAGRIFYFPRTTFENENTAWTVGVRFYPDMTANSNGVGNPWDIFAEVGGGDEPQIQVQALGTVGTDLVIEDLNDAITSGLTEDIVITQGDVFWPLASLVDGTVHKHWTGGHIGLEAEQNGRLTANTSYPPEV